MLNTFGQRLRLVRQARGVNQTDLVKALEEKHGIEIGRSYISTLEQSKVGKMPNGEVIAGLAKELGTTSDFLLLLSDDFLSQIGGVN